MPSCGCHQARAEGTVENWQDPPDKGWGYNVAIVGKEHLATAMLEKMQRIPGDIAEAWMQLIIQMGLEVGIAR